MGQPSNQTNVFCQEIANGKIIWTIKDETGYPAPKGSNGKRAMPFWSNKQRAEEMIATMADDASFELEVITWDIFRDNWLSGLERDCINVGINWSGKTAAGYDVEPHIVTELMEYYFSLSDD